MNEEQLLAKYGVSSHQPHATPSGQEYRATQKERCPYCGMVTVTREWRVDDDEEDPEKGYWVLVCSNKSCPQPERIAIDRRSARGAFFVVYLEKGRAQNVQ